MKPTIIHDSRREALFVEELFNQGVHEYEIFAAITDRSTVTACINASHRAVVAIAKYRKEPVCIILEDDVQFTAPGAWNRFIEQMPDDFDLWMGGCYSPVVDGVTASPVGFHCYTIHERYYDHFLNSDKEGHIDSMQAGGLYKVCYPMIALQRPGFSFNNKAQVDYNKILKEEDIWK